MERLLNNILQGNWASPQDTFKECLRFNKISETLSFRVANVFCWETIIKTIVDLKDKLPYVYNGLVLCTCMITKNSNISETDLELGTECIKHMADIIFDNNDNLSKKEKEFKKEWIKEFLDIWKEFTKEEIRREKKSATSNF